MFFNTNEEKRVRNVEKKSTRNNGKKGGFKEKEFQKKNEESSSSIKKMDVNEVEKITLPPSTFLSFFSLNFPSSVIFSCFRLLSFYYSSQFLFSSHRSRYLNQGRFPFRCCRLPISHVNLLSLTIAF